MREGNLERMTKRSIANTSIIVLWCTLVLGVVLVVVTNIFPCGYFYCLLREKSWLASTTKAELESRIHVPYSQKVIEPSESSWGGGHVLAEGERMVLYRIFGEPLDVVVAASGAISTFYTSYE